MRWQDMVGEDGVSAGGLLNEYAVGKNGDIYPDGSGKLMKAGTRSNSICITIPLELRSPTGPALE